MQIPWAPESKNSLKAGSLVSSHLAKKPSLTSRGGSAGPLVSSHLAKTPSLTSRGGSVGHQYRVREEGFDLRKGKEGFTSCCRELPVLWGLQDRLRFLPTAAFSEPTPAPAQHMLHEAHCRRGCFPL